MNKRIRSFSYISNELAKAAYDLDNCGSEQALAIGQLAFDYENAMYELHRSVGREQVGECYAVSEEDLQGSGASFLSEMLQSFGARCVLSEENVLYHYNGVGMFQHEPRGGVEPPAPADIVWAGEMWSWEELQLCLRAENE